MKSSQIFVTTGTQLAFPRLIGAIDEWAKTNSQALVKAQTASSDKASIQGKYKHVETEAFLTPQRYKELIEWADVVVGHAGMGTIITGFEFEKPLILMPRLFSLGEHRNDHQVATAHKFSHIPGITIVNDAPELEQALDQSDQRSCVKVREFTNRQQLIGNLMQYIWE